MANNLHKFTVAEATSKMAQRAIVRVTPTISTTAYADGDVLFLTTEIPNAVLFPGGCSLLRGVTIVDKDSNSINMDLVFMAVKKNLIGAVSPGSSGGSAISDSDIDGAKMLGALEFDIGNGDNTVDIGQAKITHAAGASGNAATTALPIFLQAEDGSTSVYFSGITRGTPNHGQTDDLEFAFHIDY